MSHRSSFSPGSSSGGIARLVIVAMVLVLSHGCDRGTPTAPATAAAKPNVLLVTIDTLRADHLGAYGYERPTSPAMDRIAAAGAVFETVYAPMATTGPSHTTMLTSRYPLAHGVVRNGIPLNEAVPLLPEMLGAHGYRTAAFVSSYPVSHRFGLARGFAQFDDDFGGAVSLKIQSWNQKPVEGQFDRLGEVTVDRALAWLGEQQVDAPWFVWVHLFDPHAPYVPPSPYDETFATPGAEKKEAMIAAYDGEILYTDTQVARLVSSMQAAAGERGLMTILTSDHGEAFWEHGRHGHNRTMFDEELRVPLIVHWPGRVAAGRRIVEPVHLVDLLPTIASATQLPLTTEVAGIDLLPAITGDARIDPARSLYLQRPDAAGRGEKKARRPSSFGVRQGAWKMVESRRATERFLFDLASDPGETKSLTAAEPARTDALVGDVAAWRKVASAAAPAKAEPVPEDVQRKLRALGYAD